MPYQVKEQLQINLKNYPEIREALNQIVEQEGITTGIALLQHFINLQNGETPDQPRVKKSKVPESSESHFVAKIDKRDRQAVETMRDDLYDRHRFKDDQIIAHWAKLHTRIKENKTYLISPPATIAKLIEEKGQPTVDDGINSSISQFLVKLIAPQLRKKEEKKSDSWW